MRIALISYEYPPAVAIGGIGSYSWSAAHMLARAGHEVTVFSAGEPGQAERSTAVEVVRLRISDRYQFAPAVAAAVAAAHRSHAFDVAESPEYAAEGAELRQVIPGLPHVVRLHTPHFLVRELNHVPPALSQQARFFLGAIRRGRLAWLRRSPAAAEPIDEREAAVSREADHIAAPCRSIRDLVASRWNLEPSRCSVIPNVYTPPASLLALPPAGTDPRILFLGRLEYRKGVLELASAIPRVLARHPGARFIFAGPALPLSGNRGDTAGQLRSLLRDHLANVEFTGPLDTAAVERELARANIAIFPSRWENFPNVCLEAMSAARAVVGSSAGGMADMIEDGISGVLVPPRDSSAIVRALDTLLGEPTRLAAMGRHARQRVIELFSERAVLPLQLAGYEAAIRHAATR